MEKEQIFEMPVPELGSPPPTACPLELPRPQHCFNPVPEQEGLPRSQAAASSLPSTVRTKASP